MLQLINPKISLIQKKLLTNFSVIYISWTKRTFQNSLQQQSARYFSPHERNNASPTTANLTVLNSASSQCYTPLSTTTDNLLHRPSCLTCPTINDHCDHPQTSTPLPPHTATAAHPFNPFHHTIMPPHHHHHISPHSGTQLVPSNNKNLMTNHHAIFDSSCQK